MKIKPFLHNQLKPKPLLQKVMALLIATISILTLTITVSASGITFGGNSDSTTTYVYSADKDFTYAFHGQYVSWRISLYVSTSEDGKIDPVNDSIVGQKGLGYRTYINWSYQVQEVS